MTIVDIVPRDALVTRDGRPLGTGVRMRSAGWIYPSVLAGSLRTLLGKAMAPAGERHPFTRQRIERLKTLHLAGPLPRSQDALYLPAPRDLLVVRAEAGERHLLPLRPQPMPAGAGCDEGLRGCWPIHIDREDKPAPAAAFWSTERIAAWLAQDGGPDEFAVPPESSDRRRGFLAGFEKELRTHVRIDPSTSTGDDGMLFSTEGLSFAADEWPLHRPWQGAEEDQRPQRAGIWLSARLETSDAEMAELLSRLDHLHPLGGERRLASFKAVHQEELWRCPPALSQALGESAGVRMLLATPALFAEGWLPGWLDGDLEGSPPGAAVRLKLRSFCAERWKPISGWDLEKRAPKPVRRMVPEGSVYFFEVVAGDPGELSRLWLRSTADEEQDRRDGFALSAWGVWNKEE